MAFSLFVNYDGNCKEAINFYSKVFNAEIKDLMTFGDAPGDPNDPILEADKDKIMYSCISVLGTNIMFSDLPTGMELVKGNNITLTVSPESKEEIVRIFNELKEGGQVHMELGPTFWSDLYGMITDKFGLGWQLSHDSEKQY